MKILRKKKFTLISFALVFGVIFTFNLLIPTPSFAEGGPCFGEDPVTGEPTPKGCDPNFTPAGGGSNTPAGGGSNTPAGGGSNTPAGGGSNTPSSTKIDASIKNPLGDSITDIPSFIEKILRFILMLGVPIVALAIIYTGFLFVTALGNSEKLKKAKQALVYTLIGAALLLGAFVIAEAIQGTVVEISNEAKK